METAKPRNVIVTGLPRSGSAAISALIDYLPGSICLNAPEWHTSVARKLGTAIPFSKWMFGDFYWQRKLMLAQTPVPDYRAEDGSPLMDGFIDPRRMPEENGEPKPVFFARPDLPQDFVLAMRHTTLYTAILPTLLRYDTFRIIAVIRNPADIIQSWIKLPQSQVTAGNPYGLMRLWPEAHMLAATEMDPLDRMAQMAELFFQRYYELQDDIDILRYEDVMDDPSLVAKRFGLEGVPSNVSKLIQKPQRRMDETTDAIRAALKKYGVCVKKFYP